MSIGKALKGLLSGVAPLLGTTLGGPLGGVAMKFLADKFTGGETGKVEDFLLSANPAVLQELKIAELDFTREMAKLDIDLEEIASKDRNSARGLAKDKGIVIQAVLSAVYTFGYFGTLFMFISGKAEVATDYTGLVTTLLGALGAAQLQIMNFWFGSSAGSKRKTEALTGAG